MRVLVFFLAAIIGVLPLLESRDLHAASAAEDAAARIPLEHYINAHATGNPDYIRKAFFPEAKIMAFRDGKLLNLQSRSLPLASAGSLLPTSRSASDASTALTLLATRASLG